jgi:hypothetical protein
MKRLTLALALALLLPLMNSCAGRNEDPQMEGAARPDTAQSEVFESFGTAIAAEPRPNPDPGRENYILRSDSARITRENGAVWIMVRGPLGDGCQRYEYYDSVASGSTLFLTFWASRPTDSTVVCTPQTQFYDKEIRIANSGYTTFSIIQPGGSTHMLQKSSLIPHCSSRPAPGKPI